MCILCAIQKWSRRVATMLPWLVIPLIGLWALSQLLPPAFRFEITSPRLACVFVLLATLFWYEILMPQLSAWRVRRDARMRERKRFKAIELQKLRKTATRRCRNCLTSYRDQNPGGGRFMCSTCGHISKRPVLDLPVPPGINNLNSGIVKELVGKSGNFWNAKSWSENGWTCNGQDYMENRNWTGGSIPGKSVYWRNGEGVVFGLDESCMTEKSYSHVVISAFKRLRSFLSSFRWLWRKIFRVGSLEDSVSVDIDTVGSLAGRGENGTNCQESRSEKARRKAEEKRQARLEKEQLEEEERKQREEVARLVEERRKIRDECEKDRARISSSIKERQKKEAEKKRQEKKKDKDKGSCKSNSDVEEMEKKVKENDRKWDSEKKSDNDRHESQKSGVDSGQGGYSTELGYGSRSGTASYTRANTGSRYLDHVRGTFLSSSKAFSKGNLFGRSAFNPTAAVKENRFVNSLDHSHAQAHRKDASHSGHVTGRPNVIGDDQHTNRPVPSEPQSAAAPKKSWGQLFSRSSTTVPLPSSNVISRPQTKDPSDELRSLPGQPLPTQSFDNPLDFGLPSPFTLSSFPDESVSTSSGYHSSTEYMLPLSGGSSQNLLPDERELFEDPCYIPDPVSLLGPVSESLDNFQLDLGTGFGTNNGLQQPFGLNNVSAPCELVRPSPIESPLSRFKVNDDTQKARNTHCSLIDNPATNNENGSWQMWNSSPLIQNGLIGGSLNWLLNVPTQSIMEENVYHSSYQSMPSLYTSNDTIISGSNSPVKAISRNSLSGGSATSPFLSAVDRDPWLEKTIFPPLSDSENHPVLNLQEEDNQNQDVHDSRKRLAGNSPFDQSPMNSWSKNQLSAHKSGEGLSISGTTVVKPSVGGLYSTPDAQSLWSV